MKLPQSLRDRFIWIILAMAFWMVAGGGTAIYALRVATRSTQQLTEVRLAQLQDAQDLVRATLLIERETNQLVKAESLTELQRLYTEIQQLLEDFDRKVDNLASSDESISIVDLQQSGQSFRNVVNIMAQLKGNSLRADPDAGNSEGKNKLLRFGSELQRQAGALSASTQSQSERVTQRYRDAVNELIVNSQSNERRVIFLTCGGIAVAYIIARNFLGKQVLSRLNQVSQSLRDDSLQDQAFVVPVSGHDEIAEMARAVERFQENRRQLRLLNKALTTEKLRQEKLIRMLADAHTQLLQSEKLAAVGQLAAGVAHELNTPVGFVHSNLGTLKRYVLDLFELLAEYESNEKTMPDEARNALKKVKDRIDLDYLKEDIQSLIAESTDGLQRVARIVHDLKDFSHVDDSGAHLISIENGIESTLHVMAGLIGANVSIIKEYVATPEVECIPSQINQVLMGVLMNAVQAIEEDGKIIIRTGYSDGMVWVEVEDNGKGIEPENISRIFDPFFTTKPVGSGVGLGLSLAYSIVKSHGGVISARSTPGQGAIFKIALPHQIAMQSEGPSSPEGQNDIEQMQASAADGGG